MHNSNLNKENVNYFIRLKKKLLITLVAKAYMLLLSILNFLNRINAQAPSIPGIKSLHK